MQLPTLENTRIRSSTDAQKIFYAVEKRILKMITKRLDVDERIALKSGNIYAWEERGPHSEVTGLGIERFTEGRRWSPSRVREDFLFYYEKYAPPPNHPGGPKAPRDWEGLVKQTYSVWVETDRGRRKWHLTAYFGSNSVEDLGTVDDIPEVTALQVPPNHYKSTRVVKPRKKPERDMERKPSRDDSTTVTRSYAPYPPVSISSETPEETTSAYNNPNHRTRRGGVGGPANPYPVLGPSSTAPGATFDSSAAPSADSAPACSSPTYSYTSFGESSSVKDWHSIPQYTSPSPYGGEHPEETKYSYTSSQVSSPISPVPHSSTSDASEPGSANTTPNPPTLTPWNHSSYNYAYTAPSVPRHQSGGSVVPTGLRTERRPALAISSAEGTAIPSVMRDHPASPASPSPSPATSSQNRATSGRGGNGYEYHSRRWESSTSADASSYIPPSSLPPSTSQHTPLSAPSVRDLTPLNRLNSVARFHPYHRDRNDELSLQLLSQSE